MNDDYIEEFMRTVIINVSVNFKEFCINDIYAITSIEEEI